MLDLYENADRLYYKQLKQKQDKKIPGGYHCYKYIRLINGVYKEYGICPYWSEDLSKDIYERGYCGYLQKGDWNINNAEQWQDIGPSGENTDTGDMLPRDRHASFLWDKEKDDGCPKWPK